MNQRIERFSKLVADPCREVIDDEHPLLVEAVGGRLRRLARPG
jgi:hypothetical protein